MKIILEEEEMMAVLKKSFPAELLPAGSKVTKLESRGYPKKEFEFTIEKED